MPQELNFRPVPHGHGPRASRVIDPRKATVTIYRQHSSPKTLGDGDVLYAGDVVPGFTCAVRRIFE
jgi:hypothetical protein